MDELQVLNIRGVDCYEKDGTAYLKLEAVARGLGFTRDKNGIEYVMWDRVGKYLDELGFHTSKQAENNLCRCGVCIQQYYPDRRACKTPSAEWDCHRGEASF